jgi:hypothetical protein
MYMITCNALMLAGSADDRFFKGLSYSDTYDALLL